jgi:site-specific DNA-methyltransferase (adenine-specific)
MSITLLQGDCLELMKDISDASIDLILCDLPYGCLERQTRSDESKKKYKRGDGLGGCSWDIKLNLETFWKEVKRIRKSDHSPCIHFCTTKFGYELIQSNPEEFRYDLVYSKSNAVGFLSANKKPMSSHEMIYVFSKAGAFYNRIDISGNFPKGGGGRSTANFLPIRGMPNTGTTHAGRRCVKSVIEVSNKKTKGGHPTEKPSELYRFLIERYCPPGGTILDPTAGSFNSCFTAYELDRHAIGIEKDEGFYKKADKRADNLT